MSNFNYFTDQDGDLGIELKANPGSVLIANNANCIQNQTDLAEFERSYFNKPVYLHHVLTAPELADQGVKLTSITEEQAKELLSHG